MRELDLGDALPTVPVTITIGGRDADLVVLELDGVGLVELMPAQARLIAGDLEDMADEAES